MDVHFCLFFETDFFSSWSIPPFPSAHVSGNKESIAHGLNGINGPRGIFLLGTRCFVSVGAWLRSCGNELEDEIAPAFEKACINGYILQDMDHVLLASLVPSIHAQVRR